MTRRPACYALLSLMVMITQQVGLSVGREDQGDNESVTRGCYLYLSDNDCRAGLYQDPHGNPACCYPKRFIFQRLPAHINADLSSLIAGSGIGFFCKARAIIIYLPGNDKYNTGLLAECHSGCGSPFVERGIFILLICTMAIMPFLCRKIKRNIYLLRIWWLKRELERFRLFGLYR